MPGDFQVIRGSVVGKNCWLPASTETPDKTKIAYI